MTMHTITRRARIWLLSALVLITAGACASSGGTRAAGKDMNRITGEEMIAARAQGISNVEELITRLRPRWLQTERIQSFHTGTGILVYDGNSMIGGPDVLANFTIDLVREIRWLNSAEAGTLPGAGSMHVEGAIVILR